MYLRGSTINSPPVGRSGAAAYRTTLQGCLRLSPEVPNNISNRWIFSHRTTNPTHRRRTTLSPLLPPSLYPGQSSAFDSSTENLHRSPTEHTHQIANKNWSNRVSSQENRHDAFNNHHVPRRPAHLPTDLTCRLPQPIPRLGASFPEHDGR